jgi:CRP-like cAMP-binding protein
MQERNNSQPAVNCLLAAMSDADRKALDPFLEEVALTRRQALIEAHSDVRRAYFVHDGVVSLVTTLKDGPNVETAMIGREGVVGLPFLFNQELSPNRAVAQASGRAAAIEIGALERAMTDSAPLRALLGGYSVAFLAQVLQSVACNVAHSTKERLAKWLLSNADRTDGVQVPLTHEFISELLGVGRPTVSLAARTLRANKLIDYRRGGIAIVDRSGLSAVACECYGVIRDTYERFLPVSFVRPPSCDAL